MRQNDYDAKGLSVSVLGLGTGQIGDHSLSESDCEFLLNRALDLGINLIDTARGYGEAETRIGRYIAHRRDEFILSTKIGYGVEGHEDWTAGCIEAGIDRALRLMNTEVLDIVHLHSCPQNVLKESGVIEALLKAAEVGKVRVPAYSGENEDLEYALDSGAFTGFMASLNIVELGAVVPLVQRMNERGLGFIAKRPIANAPWGHSTRPVGQYVEPYWLRFRELGYENDCLPSGVEAIGWLDAALRFAAFHSGVSSVIAGTKSIEHLEANVKAVERGPLDAASVEYFTARYAETADSWLGQV